MIFCTVLLVALPVVIVAVKVNQDKIVSFIPSACLFGNHINLAGEDASIAASMVLSEYVNVVNVSQHMNSPSTVAEFLNIDIPEQGFKSGGKEFIGYEEGFSKWKFVFSLAIVRNGRSNFVLAGNDKASIRPGDLGWRVSKISDFKTGPSQDGLCIAVSGRNEFDTWSPVGHLDGMYSPPPPTSGTCSVGHAEDLKLDLKFIL